MKLMLCIFIETNSHSAGGAAASGNIRGGEIGEAARITGFDCGDIALRAPRVAGTHFSQSKNRTEKAVDGDPRLVWQIVIF